MHAVHGDTIAVAIMVPLLCELQPAGATAHAYHVGARAPSAAAHGTESAALWHAAAGRARAHKRMLLRWRWPSLNHRRLCPLQQP